MEVHAEDIPAVGISRSETNRNRFQVITLCTVFLQAAGLN